MSQNNFWDNRTYAQKLVDESAAIKRRIEPLLKAETQHADMQTMLELADGEDEATQKEIQSELAADLAKFTERLEALELELMLAGPHDRSNCILSINAGAGGTESCDWANMLLRMYQRWGEERGWQVEALLGAGRAMPSDGWEGVDECQALVWRTSIALAWLIPQPVSCRTRSPSRSSVQISRLSPKYSPPAPS